MKMRQTARTWLLMTALAVLAAAVLAACGGSGGGYGGGGGSSSATPALSTSPAAGSGAGSGAKSVTIQNFAFSPATLTVEAGTKVTWTNDDGAPHNVTSTDGPGTDAATTSVFSSGDLAQGETFSFTFDEPGTYYYECTIHASMASMHAEVVVR